MSKHFTIQYSDGSKGNISSAQKQHLLLSGEITELRADTFKFIGKALVVHSFAELRKLVPGIETNLLRRFYPGSFVLEFKGKRVRELLETPEAMALAMAKA